ncbi:MAG: hypothetical protein KDB82_14865 [Planctomycetes bacterium]|nr:hypothetical protein [Planctomycetota bacterium]
MHRTFAVILVCLLAGSLSAQVFPRIEKKAVMSRITSGKPEPEVKETPEPEDPVDKEDVVDGEKALKRYNELLAGYARDERAQKKAFTKHTDEVHVSVRDYLEGIYLMRLGYYKDAERKLKDVGVNVRRESEISTPELIAASEEIKDGSSYYYRMIAVVMQEWDDFKDQEEAEEAWKKASTEGIKIRAELVKLVKEGKASSDSDVEKLMTGWLLAAKRQWVQTWRRETNIHEHPESSLSWQFFIASTGSRGNNMKEEYTPNYLKQRAALQVMKEFWPDSAYLKNGTCDATLAVNYLSTGQLDDVEPCLEVKEYHNFLGRTALQKGKKAYDDVKKLVKALQNK